MKFGYITDRGRRRKKNEDSIKIISNENFFMLADGVGGNKSGEIASKCALEALEKYVREILSMLLLQKRKYSGIFLMQLTS